MRSSVCLRLVAAATVAAAMTHVPSLSAQQTAGTVEGKVVEGGSNRPLAGVQVFVAGTPLGTVSANDGSYRITTVPARQVEIRARLLGYAPAARPLVVTAGQVASANFELQLSALQLEQVVVTGSGQATEVKRLGNTVAVVQVPPDMPIADVSALLTAREPGISAVTSAGLTGQGARIRIRGNASITQSNEPVVFVDGVRINSGGGQTSRLDDIDPATIERVEVLKGAAAATLYGTEASNGVIQIFTKKGSTGSPKWTFSAQQEGIQFPDRVDPNAGYARTQARADSLAQFWNIPGLRPFQVFEVPIWNDYFTETGAASTLAAQVDGGGPNVSYFASGRFQTEDGPIGGESVGPARDNLRRVQSLANISLVPFNSLRLGVRSGFFNVYNGIPGGGIIGNSIYGTYALTGYARPEVANCNLSSYVAPGQCSGPGNPFGNAAFMSVRESLQQITEERINRTTGSVNATYTPHNEVSVDLTGGWDVTARDAFSFSRFRYDIDLYTQNNIEGSRSVSASNTRMLTLDGKASWNRNVTSDLSSAFVAGLQVFNERATASSGSSTSLPGPGIEVVGAGGLNIVVGESFQTQINGGYFAQEQLGYKNVAFLTLGGRYDFASAFGSNAPGVFYPKASLSVVPSDLASWNSPLGLNTLRLRAAWGQSGRQPGAFDKFTTFAPIRGELGAGLVPSQLGNQDLKPEIATEIEGGFEAGLFGDRLGLNATVWKRRVDDLLVARQFPVSGGFRRSQLDNIGQVDATGYELGARAYAISTPTLQLELNANAAWLEQTMTSLGGAPNLKTNAGYIRHRVFLKAGAPLGAIYTPRLATTCPGGGTTPANNSLGKPIVCYGPDQFPISLNGNGRAATRAELLAYLAQSRDLKTTAVQNALRPLLADFDGSGNVSEQLVGDIFPDWTGNIGGTLTFRRNWRLTTNFEWRTGFMVHNLTDAFRGSQHATIGSNLKDYVEIEAVLANPASTPEQRVDAADKYIRNYRRLLEPGLSEMEPGDFLRMRELALTWTAPNSIANRLRARNLSLTLSGRNLALWTKYSGVDPEIAYSGREPGGGLQANFNEASDSFGMPVPRRFSLLVNLGF
ncbi:MAG: SusC/RagA family TonB-linked outer membrane protein [Gemmatimonadaceae bacterium]